MAPRTATNRGEDGTAAGRGADPPRRARGQATRARLMEAGVKTFPRKGFHATRVDDIVKQAKTSHGTFYLYFSSKQDLFDELVSEVAREFHALTDALPVIADDAEGRAAIEEWLRSFVDLYDDYGPLIRSWTDAEAPGEGSGVPDLLGTISEELAAKVRVRSSRRFDPGIAALVVVATVERLNYLLATEQLQDSRDRVAEVLAAIAMDAFFGPGH